MQITTQTSHVYDLDAELTQVGGWDTEGSYSDSDGGDRSLEGSEDGFDESGFVDNDLEEEERSADGEDGSGQEGGDREGNGCRSPEGSDLAAEEGCDEGKVTRIRKRVRGGVG